MLAGVLGLVAAVFASLYIRERIARLRLADKFARERVEHQRTVSYLAGRLEARRLGDELIADLLRRELGRDTPKPPPTGGWRPRVIPGGGGIESAAFIAGLGSLTALVLDRIRDHLIPMTVLATAASVATGGIVLLPHVTHEPAHEAKAAAVTPSPGRLTPPAQQPTRGPSPRVETPPLPPAALVAPATSPPALAQVPTPTPSHHDTPTPTPTAGPASTSTPTPTPTPKPTGATVKPQAPTSTPTPRPTKGLPFPKPTGCPAGAMC